MMNMEFLNFLDINPRLMKQLSLEGNGCFITTGVYSFMNDSTRGARDSNVLIKFMGPQRLFTSWLLLFSDFLPKISIMEIIRPLWIFCQENNAIME